MDAGLALESRHTVLARKAVGAHPGDDAIEPKACSGVFSGAQRDLVRRPAFRSWRDRSDSGVSSRFSAGKKAQGWTNPSLQTPGPGADRGSGVANRERPPGEGIDRDGDRGLALGECEIARQRIARGCHRRGLAQFGACLALIIMIPPVIANTRRNGMTKNPA